nr:hypothetical protein TIFTF001_052797 [Ficus carica]
MKPVNLGFVSFDICRATHVPKKPNLFDCGVFVILFMQSGRKLDSRSYVFDSNEERCRLAGWLACSNYNKLRAKLLKDVREFHFNGQS